MTSDIEAAARRNMEIENARIVAARAGARPQQCAGLMAVLTREGEPNQIMQVAQRFGTLDPGLLDPARDAYGSWAEVCAAHDGEEP